MKIVPQLDTYPRLIRLVQTPAGRLACLVAFALLLLLNGNPYWMELSLLSGLMGVFPRHRRKLLSLLAIYWLLRHGQAWLWPGLAGKAAAAAGLSGGAVPLAMAAALATVFGCLYALFHAVRRRPDSLAGRRPVLVLLSCYLLTLGLAGSLPLHGAARAAIWLALASISGYLWYFAYALCDAAAKHADPFALQFGTFFPFWSGAHTTPTPIAKGAAFLRKVEVGDAKDAAALRLNAVKLLIWTSFVHLFSFSLQTLVHGPAGHSAILEPISRALGLHATVPGFHVPYLGAALDRAEAGVMISPGLAWASVATHFAEAVADMTVMGNQVVACCRMSGFRVLRNTYKPLYAGSLADFWNRYYFYFKELLVEFFFYPTYVRYFKKHGRLRMAAATFAAATFGNVLYHFCRDIHYVFDMGLWKALLGCRVYLFYAAILGTGIVISQLRGRRVRYESLPVYRRAIASATVVAFFCLLEIFDYEGRTHSLGTHVAFFLNLFLLR
jgi:hypothetical protein